MEEVSDDFVNRQLSDTRYISRLAADYVALLFGGRIDEIRTQRVQVSGGAATAYVRGQWEMNAILSDGPEKDRHDHRHHAVDAVAIALTGTRTVKLLSRAAEFASDQGHRRLFVPVDEPWKGFLDQVRTAIDEINVSYRVDRRVSGWGSVRCRSPHLAA